MSKHQKSHCYPQILLQCNNYQNVPLRRVFISPALITSGESFRDIINASGFYEQEISQPRCRQRHDLVFVFKDEAKTPAFGQIAKFPYQGFERSMRLNIEYVINHAAFIAAFRAVSKLFN